MTDDTLRKADPDGTKPEGKEIRTFRARWYGHVEIKAQSKEEALEIHDAMTAEDILEELIFDGIEEV